MHSIDLHFPANFGAARTTVTFIGLRGEFTERKRQAVEAVYESKPMPQASTVQRGPACSALKGGREGGGTSCCPAVLPASTPAGPQGAGAARSGVEPGHVACSVQGQL